MAALFFWQPQGAHSQSSDLTITQVGLSQAQGTTFLTMILNRPEQPRVQPVADRTSPQLLIDFPKARITDVPLVQAGDQQLVKQVRTSSLPGGGGVRIIVDLVPDRPYSFWRSSKSGAKGGFQYMVGLKPDSPASGGSVAGAADRRATGPGQESAERPASSSTYSSAGRSGPSGADESSASGDSRRTASSEYYRPTSGELAEIGRLMPEAGPVLGFLEQKGWQVQKDTTGRKRPGSQKFLLASSQFPNLSVTAEHIPTKAPGSPGINIIALSTDKLADSDADKYRQMVRWDLAEIKKHYEDIGDYYDDGLKPLRIRLRERSKATVLRDYEFYKQFIEVAVPQKPELSEQIRKHVQDRVNKRLEGAQYTESENPLVIMDMVDFYSLRVYFIGR
jgi:hypothetical protein